MHLSLEAVSLAWVIETLKWVTLLVAIFPFQLITYPNQSSFRSLSSSPIELSKTWLTLLCVSLIETWTEFHILSPFRPNSSVIGWSSRNLRSQLSKWKMKLSQRPRLSMRWDLPAWTSALRLSRSSMATLNKLATTFSKWWLELTEEINLTNSARETCFEKLDKHYHLFWD